MVTRYVSLNELAEALNLSSAFLRTLADEGNIPFLKANQRRRFCVHAVKLALDDIASRQTQAREGRAMGIPDPRTDQFVTIKHLDEKIAPLLKTM